jgi:predicted phage tail protein
MLFQGLFQMICRRMVLMGSWIRASRTISTPLFVSNATAFLKETGKRAMLNPMATMLTHFSRRQLLCGMEQHRCSNAASTERW